jgi:hypothetical protein
VVRRVALLSLVSVAGLFALWLLFGPVQRSLAHPDVPFDPAGVARCDTCHGPNAAPRAPDAEPVPLLPADHATYTQESCATCHVAIAATSPLAASYAECATCHAKTDTVATLPSGETLAVTVDIPKYLSSVHGDFACTECHESQETIPHQPLTAEGKRAFTQQMAELCADCHRGPAASYAESFHGMAERLGVIRAAACTDCHTPHAVQAVATWSLADRAASCGTCHLGATESFASGWMGHQEPSTGWFPAVFYAEKGFVALTALVLGVGIVHVEVDALRWITNKVRRKKDEDDA